VPERPRKGLKVLGGGLLFVAVVAVLLALVRHQPGGGGSGGVDQSPDAAPFGPATRAFTLYFLDERGDLTAERREVAAKASLTDQVAAVIDEELAGSMAGNTSAVPDGTTLRHVFIDQTGTAVIDLSRDIVRNQPGSFSGEHATLAALVRCVRANFPNLSAVQILVEGKPEATLAGHFSIEGPLFGDDWLAAAGNR
jgi:spore germination protein GerM